MKYRITHTTSYKYSTPVSVCHNVVMLTPHECPGLIVHQHQLAIEPGPARIHQRQDMFGNVVQRFSLEESHAKLVIKAVSEVSVQDRSDLAGVTSPTCRQVVAGLADRTDARWLDVIPFVFDSPRIRRSADFHAWASADLPPDRPIVEAALALTKHIYQEFRYDKDATQVDTPTSVAFEARHGVCQDFAHVGVACLRSHGIAARYVSGYLRTLPPEGKPRLVGADQSHAWLSVYCGETLGWVDFDPTNNCLCSTDHVTVASGRDYSDVVPIKGVFLGGGEPTLSVSVDVAPLDAD
ncbi:MAG: transglutaminase family protein [Planctomycetaceae bacterium]|nr:transglutaminase family protein [Planctomycetaceae bacterium]